MLALRGVALVVDDRKGPKLAFCFPRSASLAAASEDDADYFARLLRPKGPLCNAPLTLGIDETLFLSYPTLLRQQTSDSQQQQHAGVAPLPSTPVAPPAAHHFDRSDGNADAAIPSDRGDGDAAAARATRPHPSSDPAALTLFNVVFILHPTAALQPDPSEGTSLAPTGSQRAARDALISGMLDVAQRVSAALLYLESGAAYVTRQVEEMLRLGGPSLVGAAEGRGPAEGPAPLETYPFPPTHLLDFAASPQLRAPLARELAYVFHCLQGGLGSSCHLSFCRGWLAVSLSLSMESPMESRTDTIATMDGGVLPPGRGLLAGRQTASETPAADASPEGGGDSNPIKARDLSMMPPIRPYHTLFLLRKRDAVLALLPPDASPQLALLVRCANPQRSFHELQNDTGVPSSQLLRLAGHLVHWGLAEISDTITKRSVYAVDPSASTDPGSPLAREFAALFGQGAGPLDNERAQVPAGDSGTGQVGTGPRAAPGGLTTLGSVLASFSKASSYVNPASALAGSAGTTGRGIPVKVLIEDASPAQEVRFVTMLVWLLKTRFLREVHSYVYLFWPWPAPQWPVGPSRAAICSSGSSRGGDTGSAGNPTLAGGSAAEAGASFSGNVTSSAGAGGEELGLFSVSDLQYLAEATEGHDPALVDTLYRLVAYLRETMVSLGGGEEWLLSPATLLSLRVEEIMLRLYVSREELGAVIEEFPFLLVTSSHE